ncbi:MFS transporter [Orrella marina]|uniref:MFS transporter n=1 Tax=Orrella marina TaxID=2163011 RepID=A0A2R4XQ05_9BURK|nr:MFS transporter [Orrella marina]AWB35893.1 MFS transporter [Orrella marina]
MVPFIVGCALFMQMLDATVIAIALPAMATEFAVPAVRLNTAITAYLMAAAVFVPICGWAADRFGARRVFVTSIVIFTVSSAGCASASTVADLVGWRIVQGIGGAMMVPVGRLIMLRTVAKHELLRAMAFLSLPALMGPVLGPPVGGFLVTYASWHWIFLMNLPIGILGIFMSLRYIAAQANETTDKPLDLLGFLLSATCMATLVAAFELMASRALPPVWIGLMILTGIACGYLYKGHAQRHANPIIDLTLLNIPTFKESVLGGNLCRFTIGATPFLLALLLQTGFGMSAMSAGLITFASALGAMAMKFCAPPILKQWGYRRVLMVNSVITGATMALCATFTSTTPVWLMIGILLVSGFFRSLQFTAINTLGFADIPQSKLSVASGFSAMAQQLGISVGVAVAALVINTSMSLNAHEIPATSDITLGFIVIGLICALGALFFMRLPASAGEILQNRRK